MNRSYIYRAIHPRFSETTDRQRVLAILERSRQLIKDRYGVDMLVVLWDKALNPPPEIYQARIAWFADKLSSSGITSLSLSQIAPVPQGPSYYIPGDGHPNAAAYAAVAKAVAAHCSKVGCYKRD